jgi:hypothetical protein
MNILEHRFLVRRIKNLIRGRLKNISLMGFIVQLRRNTLQPVGTLGKISMKYSDVHKKTLICI